jgi:hypothetical protein
VDISSPQAQKAKRPSTPLSRRSRTNEKAGDYSPAFFLSETLA